jgi:RNA polymerase sigma factor (sigma-70 family)
MAAPSVQGAVSPPSSLPPFERVVELHGPALLRFCAAQAGAGRAEDCFQETLLSALRAYGELRDPGAVRAWLFSIAARKALDARRAELRAPRTEPELDPPAAEPPAEGDPALWARVRRLPDKQRRAVSLRYRGELSYREIGAVMETSEAAARRNVFEGLARLRQEVPS